MVRPKKNDESILSCFVRVRFTPKEYTKLKMRYDQTRYTSLSAFLRVIMMEFKVISCSNPNDIIIEKIECQNIKFKELTNQIAHIGNNINQIAKKVNSQKIVKEEDLIIIRSDLNKIYELVSSLSFKEINDRKD